MARDQYRELFAEEKYKKQNMQETDIIINIKSI